MRGAITDFYDEAGLVPPFISSGSLAMFAAIRRVLIVGKQLGNGAPAPPPRKKLNDVYFTLYHKKSTLSLSLGESTILRVCRMTSLLAWISVDSKSVAAMYLASDSRISWGSKRIRWDAGRKLFLCRKTPDIFGFAGDVTFSSLSLTQICEAADADMLFAKDDDTSLRHEKFLRLLTHSFGHRHNAPKEWIHLCMDRGKVRESMRTLGFGKQLFARTMGSFWITK